ncbi:MAG: DEAD/DEAH box helicase, partial [Tardiphaga sp.]
MPPRQKPVAKPDLLPDRFLRWFARRGWSPREHQLALLEKARAERSALLIAPTGAGKTLAGFLPTLVELAEAAPQALPAPSPLVGEGGGEGAPGTAPALRKAKGKKTMAVPAAPSPVSDALRASDPPSPTRGEGTEVLAAPPKLVSTGRSVARGRGLHTLYISPLKALAVDIARNLEAPIAEMKLPIRVETRTGDTPVSRRARQRRYPPDILLTTPEQLALLLSSDDAPFLFSSLKRVVLDELHALVTSKRGDLLSLDLARLRSLAPQVSAVGLSATVREPADLQRFLGGTETPAGLVTVTGGAAARIGILQTETRLPLAGHTTGHAMGAVYEAIKAHKLTLVFVNTRMQAEFAFQALWTINDDNLPIALHHGSLDVAQRRKVEAAMADGR